MLQSIAQGCLSTQKLSFNDKLLILYYKGISQADIVKETHLVTIILCDCQSELANFSSLHYFLCFRKSLSVAQVKNSISAGHKFYSISKSFSLYVLKNYFLLFYCIYISSFSLFILYERLEIIFRAVSLIITSITGLFYINIYIQTQEFILRPYEIR